MRNRYALYADDGTPAVVVNGRARSPFFLVCEHASKRIPAVLGDMGLNRKELHSHIAWDIGAGAVARHMSKLLDAPLVLQRYSRLVYDCNRPPESASAIPEVSEATAIPANRDLQADDKKARAEELYFPFHERISALLDERQADGQVPILVTIHSFTPVYLGKPRHLDLGILHDEDDRFANAMLDVAAGDTAHVTLRNEPYGPQDGVTHTLNLHSRERSLLNVMLEIRNDLVASRDGQLYWAKLLAGMLTSALAAMPDADSGPARSATG